MVALELDCRKVKGIHLLAAEELLFSGRNRPPFRWNVKVNNAVSLGIVPDRVFALNSEKESPTEIQPSIFLEADRGTMPIVRKNLSQSSFYRKVMAYAATWEAGLAYRSKFGFYRFRVLTVTTKRGAGRITGGSVLAIEKWAWPVSLCRSGSHSKNTVTF